MWSSAFASDASGFFDTLATHGYPPSAQDEGAIARPRFAPYRDVVPTQLEAIEAPPSARPFFVAHHKALVVGARTMLLMLVIAALVVLGLGAVALIRGGGPEVDGWLRAVFGRVFGVVAIGMAAVLGVPAAAGLWSMAGATADDAVPALDPLPRRILAGIAVATVFATALAVLLDGSQVRILNLGVVGLVALALLGLAGAASYSPHRARAAVAAVALVVVATGTAWVLFRVFLGTPV
jgi:hypothetical protein